jgi:tetratricopeptide (TPR) repeat protein
MSSQSLSWANVMVGDPLYRPYRSWLEIDAKPVAAIADAGWRMYHEFALKNGSKPAPEYRALARQIASRGRNAPMIEDLGQTEAREKNFAAAASYFQQARTLYTKRDDILRVVLEESDAWIKLGKPKRALDLVRSVLRIVSDAPAAPLLRKIESDLVPPPPTPPPAPPQKH